MNIAKELRSYPDLKMKDLVKLIREEYVPAIRESFSTIITLLGSAHIVEPSEEEVNYILHHVQRLAEEFRVHAETEDTKLFPVKHFLYTDDHHLDREAGRLLQESLKEHARFRFEMSNIRNLSAEYHCEVTSSPSHKLAYAQLSDLEQDMKRLFFIEEEYLFPKLKRTFKSV
ncbi:MAG TPA: hypothetical protein VL651_10825 [Bacteroidia bacterium]|nr:hypothetical protein [Bacteroidia bacterium]